MASESTSSQQSQQLIQSSKPVTHSKAPIDLKSKKNRNPTPTFFKKKKSPYKVRVILPKKQFAETQHAKVTVATADVTVATADVTKSLVAFELADEQGNQPSAIETEKVLDKNVEEEVKDTRFMSDESGHYSAQSDPLGHLHAELSLLNTKIDQLESSISEKVVEAMKSSVPAIVADTLKEQLPSLLFDALKDTLPQLINDSIKSSVLEFIAEELPQVEAQVQKNLQN
ncbi:hypothetical protein Tco_0072660 [Tanacetum coccineum]